MNYVRTLNITQQSTIAKKTRAVLPNIGFNNLGNYDYHDYFQYKNIPVYISSYTANYENHTSVTNAYKVAGEITRDIPVDLSLTTIYYVKLKNGIYVSNLAGSDKDFIIVGDSECGYFIETQENSTGASSDILHSFCCTNGSIYVISPNSFSSISYASNPMKGIIMPYLFSVDNTAPLFSEKVNRCPNENIRAMKQRTIFELDNTPYIKLHDDMVFEIDKNEYTSINILNESLYNAQNAAITYVDDGVSVYGAQGSNSTLSTQNKIDFTGFTKMSITFYRNAYNGWGQLWLGIGNDLNTTINENTHLVDTSVNSPVTIELDISNINGYKYAKFAFIASTIVITDWHLE